MGITFAGVPLLLEDVSHEFQSWLDKWLSLADLRIFPSQPIALTDFRSAARSPSPARTGYGIPNWSAPPRPKINTLWWPTGATRWAVGLFLASTDQKDQILEAIEDTGYGTLKIEEESSRPEDDRGTIEAEKMYLLPPRPLAGPQEDADSVNIYLMPIVCQRYWWQFRDVEEFEVTEDTQWSDIQSAIETAIAEMYGNTVIPSDGSPADAGVYFRWGEVHSAYRQPHNLEMSRPFENVAVLLDTVASSTGRRVVLQLDGAIEVQTSAGRAAEILADAEYKSRVAGGTVRSETDTRVPEKVRVVFPMQKQNRADPNGYNWGSNANGRGVYTVDNSASDITDFPSIPGTIKSIYCSAPADMTGNVSSPVNLSTMNLLAERIATDYYKWLEKGDDITYAGVTEYLFTGYDDWAWWHYGYQSPRHVSQYPWDDDPEHLDGDYSAFTRIACMPEGFGVSQSLNSFGGEQSLKFITEFVLTAALVAGSGAAAKYRIWSGSGFVTSDDTLTVYDTKSMSGAIGKIGTAMFDWDADRWIVIQLQC